MTQNDAEKRLTGAQLKALAILAAGGKGTEAQRAAGVSRATLFRWQHDDLFRAELRNLEAESLALLGRRVLALGDAAADALNDALDVTQPIGARLRAADLVTARGPALAEISNILVRLEALEHDRHTDTAD